MTRRAVVTGAGGFIGRNLVRHLAPLGEVLAIDLEPFEAPPGVTVVAADVAEPGALRPHIDAGTTVFHLAANANIARSAADPEMDLRETFLSTFRALQAVRDAGARLVFTSSVAVLDSRNDLPLAERAFPRPTSPYGAGKLAGEAYCFAYGRTYGTDVRVARLFNVYGVGMHQFVIYDLVRKIEADPSVLHLLGDGEQMRDYLYVDDAVRALATIADAGAPGEDYNVASGTPTRIMDLARAIASLMGVPDIEIRTTGESWPGDITKWYGDPSKLNALGFAPSVTLDDGLRRTVEWLRAR